MTLPFVEKRTADRRKDSATSKLIGRALVLHRVFGHAPALNLLIRAGVPTDFALSALTRKQDRRIRNGRSKWAGVPDIGAPNLKEILA